MFGPLIHKLLTARGWSRRVYYTGTPDRAWAHYHDRAGRLRYRRNLW